MKNIQNANLPFLNMQNKKNFTNFENSKNKVPLAKIEDQSNYIYQPNLSPTSKQSNQINTTNLSVVKKDASITKPQKKQEEVNGEEEYKLCLKKALTEAISENDYLREELKRVNEENKELKKDLEEKENALVELAQFYEYCKEHHINKDDNGNANDNDNEDDLSEEKRKIKRRKSNSF